MNGEQIFSQINHESHTGRNVGLAVAAAVIIAAAGFLYYWNFLRTPETPPVPAAAEPAPADLGSQIYKKAANPVAGELPETVAPVPNPVEGVYQNPFE